MESSFGVPVSVRVRGLSVSFPAPSGSGSALASWVPWSRQPGGDSTDDTAHAQKFPQRIPILRDVSFTVAPGRVVAILGSSGSGKTTLLHALAGRTAAAHVSGSIAFNEHSQAAFLASGRVAYVRQQDYLLPYLTVRETLRYVSELRLPPTLSRTAKYALVEEVILDLGLADCANTIIGDEWQKGISGGEKRRVSVACQLLVHPSALFLDEPTTGLDSFTAHALVKLLVQLARRGQTIFLSIHQARSELFHLFDTILLLAQGQLVYAGPGSEAVPYFERLGHPFPLEANPADLLIDITSIDSRDAEAEARSAAAVGRLIEAWRAHATAETGEVDALPAGKELEAGPGTTKAAPEQHPASLTMVRSSPVAQALILGRRSFRNLLRDNLSLWGNLVETVVVSLLFGAIFFQMDETVQGVLTRRAALYIICSMQTYLMVIFYIYKQTRELQVFDRERADNLYQVAPFLVGNYVAQLPANLAFPMIYSVITYFMLGLRSDDLAAHFGRYALLNILNHQVVVAYATFCVAAFRDFASASLLGNSLFTFFSFSTGFFLQLDSMPVYVGWIQRIGFLTYAYRGFSSNEFSGNVYRCAPTSPICVGNNVLRTLGIAVDDYAPNFVALLVCFLAFAVLSALCLQMLPGASTKHAAPRPPRQVGKGAASAASTIKDAQKLQPAADSTPAPIPFGGLVTPTTGPDARTAPDSTTSTTLRALPRVDIQLDRVHLDILTRHPLMGHEHCKPVLEEVSAAFPAGAVSCILGASGAGKSTLLALLTARTMRLAAFSRLRQTGSFRFNGHEETDVRRISSVCSFVRQDDTALLPALTALETLRYAALLRLPPSMSRVEKCRRAEEMLVLLGLRHCAHTVVGDELLTGLSGGQRRRLSIGVQLLTDPSVLVVDEPTSGLDAWSAHQIMLLLKRLADQGRTVICSIHQPRTDIYNTFDQVLLLGRGGRVMYAGPAGRMLPYLQEEAGHVLPPLTNPADFVLDLSSIDFRSPAAEQASRAQTDRLVQLWQERREDHTDAEEAYLSSERNRQRNVEAGLPLERIALRAVAPFTTAFPTLLQRGMLNTYRQPHIVVSRILQVVFLGVILCLFYARQGDGQVSVQNRVGILQQTLSVLFVGLLNCVAVFPAERDVLFHEHMDRAYGVWPAFLAYNVIEVPVEVVSAVGFTLLVMVGIGIHVTVGAFFSMCLVVFCLVNVGESVGIAFCSLVRHVGFSVSLTNAVLSAVVVMSGIMSAGMPVFLDRLNRISPVAYGARILVVQEFGSEDVRFTCTPEEERAGLCLFRSGADVLSSLVSPNADTLPFDPAQLGMYFGVVVALTLAYRALAFGVLRWRAN